MIYICTYNIENKENTENYIEVTNMVQGYRNYKYHTLSVSTK